MKKVGILGGTFDPPHIGHLIIANEVLDALSLDEIRFMPNHVPPHKQKTQQVSNQDRLSMLEDATSGHPGFFVEDIEIVRKGTSFTLDTVKLLKNREPEVEFCFIIGADMIEYLPNWHGIEELVTLISFIGVKRPGYEESTRYPVTMVEMPELHLSSSLIRERIKTGQTTQYLLTDNVREYIKENGLYES